MDVGLSGFRRKLWGKLLAAGGLLQVGGSGSGWRAEAVWSGEGDVIYGCCSSGSGADEHGHSCCISFIVITCMHEAGSQFLQSVECHW